MKPTTTQPQGSPASDCSHLDELYAMFCIARDSFIKTHFPKPKLQIYLHNPLWHLYDAEEDRRELDDALARYATKWWKSQGMTITLNRQDGSFTVGENVKDQAREPSGLNPTTAP